MTIAPVLPASQSIGDVGKDLIEWDFWLQTKQRSMSRSYVDITPDQLFKAGYVKSGVDMMTFFTNTYNHWKMALSSNGKTYYLDIKMEGDDMVIDNKNVFRTAKDERPNITIIQNTGLANEMVC